MRDNKRPGALVPELELREESDERSELLVARRGQVASRTALHLVICNLVAGVELRLQEGDEEVQEVDAKVVYNCDFQTLAISR